MLLCIDRPVTQEGEETAEEEEKAAILGLRVGNCLIAKRLQPSLRQGQEQSRANWGCVLRLKSTHFLSCFRNEVL